MNQAVGTLGDDVVGTSWLAKEHWGRGLATEGARRALRYAFLVCRVH